MSSEPCSTTKYVLQDFANDTTLWFNTAEEIGEYLTEKALIDPAEYSAYELGKEVKFKLVPT
jgi:hypothetical protein